MLEELIKNAEKILEKPEETVFDLKIDRLAKLGIPNFKIKRPDTVLMASYYERDNNIKYLISESIVEPNFSDKKLQKAFGATGAKAKEILVEKIFSKDEINAIDVVIGNLLRSKRSASIVDDIKN